MITFSLNRFLLFVVALISLISSPLLAAKDTVISNDKVIITFDISKGTWSCKTINGDKLIGNAAFLIITEDGKKYYSSSTKYNRSIKKKSESDKTGAVQKLEIEFKSDDSGIPGAILSLSVYEGKSYFTIEVKAKNNSPGKISVREIQAIKLDEKKDARLYFQGLANNVKCLIDGYNPGNESRIISFNDEKDISGYTTAALYNLTTKESLIIGSLSNKKSISLIAMHLLDGKEQGYSTFDFTFSSYFVYHPLQPGESASTGPIIIDMPDNVLDGLEQYADMIAKVNDIKLDKKPLTGWCSWYYIYPDITEKEVLLNMNFLSENLKDYGLEYIQVDRGRTLTGTDWLTTNSKFPHDMKWLAQQIHDTGFKAGLWTAPYWLGRDSKFYNPDWVLQKFSTEPKQEGKRRRHWASWGDALDTSNDEVTGYMKKIVNTIVKEWDYDYLKNDFLSYGLPEIKGIDKVFLEKGEISGEKKFPRKNIDITPIEAYQLGIKKIKQAAGDDTFIMACGAPLFNSLGYVNAARVGGDIQSKLCNTWECGTSKTVRTSAKRYYYNGRTMWIDPDCLVIWNPCGRGTFTIEEARVRVSLASLFGGMIMMSDRMYELPPERVDLLKRVMPVYPKSARPIDLFEKDMPEIWLWDIDKDFGNWHVLGVFNYNNKPVKRELSYDYLGLDTTKQYIMYDFWNKKMPTRSSRYNFRSLMPFDKEMALELAPTSCKIIAIHEKLPHPQVISTNRHLTQGAVDLDDVAWNEKIKRLSGISNLVKNDNYQIVITLPEGMEFIEAEVKEDNVACEAYLDDPDVDRYNTVKVNLKSPESRKVNWSVVFK